MSTELDALTAELMAADVTYQLAKIATAQHRVAVSLASDVRPLVLARLKSLGIAEAAGAAYAGLPLTQMHVDALLFAMGQMSALRGDLRNKVSAIAVAEKHGPQRSKGAT